MNELQAARIIRLAEAIREQILVMQQTKSVAQDDLLFIARLLGALEENVKQIEVTSNGKI